MPISKHLVSPKPTLCIPCFYTRALFTNLATATRLFLLRLFVHASLVTTRMSLLVD